MNKKPICIYHKNCADGFGAAWAVWKKHGDEFEYHASAYGDVAPDFAYRDVYMVDFSFKAPVINQMLWSGAKVTVIDHHKTAEAELKPFFDLGKIDGIFDMEKSGAMLAWEWFHPDEDPPKLLKHIQDRDLWKFELEGTREIQAALFSYPYDFHEWDKLFTMPGNCTDLYMDGRAIERKHHKDIAELVKVVQRRMTIGGYDVPVANLPYTMTSDAGHLMANNEPFAACYWDTPRGRVFSLRSQDGGMDVSEVAKSYGGGGHKNAAGFELSYDKVFEEGLI